MSGAPDDTPKAAWPIRIFVRVGALRRFHVLKQKTAELPVVVEWDRRRRERRNSDAGMPPDARQRDRRGAPPFTWEAADFVVVEDPAPEDQ